MTSYQAIASFNSSNSTQAHIIRDDAEALSIATTLSERFKEKVCNVMPSGFCLLRKLSNLVSLAFGQLPYQNALAVQMFLA